MVNKIKLREEIKITKTLNNVSDVAGETIRIKVAWNALAQVFRQKNQQLLDKNRNWVVRDPKLAEEFDYFTNSNTSGQLTKSWENYMDLMKSADRLFPKNESQVGSLRAFKFLQQCVGDTPFNIIYSSGTYVSASDFGDSVPTNESEELLEINNRLKLLEVENTKLKEQIKIIIQSLEKLEVEEQKKTKLESKATRDVSEINQNELEVLRQRNSAYERYLKKQRDAKIELEKELSNLQLQQSEAQIQIPPK